MTGHPGAVDPQRDPGDCQPRTASAEPGWGIPLDRVRFGRLDPTTPLAGERFVDLASFGGVRVEHIVSSDSPDAGAQVQDWDEWVLVVAGSTQLEVVGTVTTLAAGDWVLLPAGTPHRVLRTEPGTQWLAVHGPGEAGRAP